MKYVAALDVQAPCHISMYIAPLIFNSASTINVFDFAFSQHADASELAFPMTNSLARSSAH